MEPQGKNERLIPHASPAMVPDDHPLAPASLADLIARMAEGPPKSGAEALRDLRTAFPDAPLALRVAALQHLSRRPGARPSA